VLTVERLLLPYSYWKPGQYTSFAGAEREQSFDCHFAGEHTSIDFQGYLNGGTETGERAPDEIVADLSKQLPRRATSGSQRARPEARLRPSCDRSSLIARRRHQFATGMLTAATVGR
jgi:hypothetical protein